VLDGPRRLVRLQRRRSLRDQPSAIGDELLEARCPRSATWGRPAEPFPAADEAAPRAGVRSAGLTGSGRRRRLGWPRRQKIGGQPRWYSRQLHLRLGQLGELVSGRSAARAARLRAMHRGQRV
jgi:hypothetical protein